MRKRLAYTVVALVLVSQGLAIQAKQTPPSTTPNRTKVVRLIIVPEAVAKDPAALRRLVETESAAKTDIFIVGNQPMSYVGGQLIDHHTAVRKDRETVVFAMVRELEQIQWESNVEFEITRIAKVNEQITTFEQNPKAPENPFVAVKVGAKGGPGKPIRSGIASLTNFPDGLGQLYKLSFVIIVNGQRREIDPDVYCDM